MSTAGQVEKRKGGLPSMRTRIKDLFNIDSFFDEPLFDMPSLPAWFSKVPATNIRETEDRFIVEMAAPGLKKKDFQINVENGVLQIKVEKEYAKETEEKNLTRKEYSYSNFNRSFSVPDNVNEESIEARYADGVLYVDLFKMADESHNHKKEIQVK